MAHRLLRNQERVFSQRMLRRLSALIGMVLLIAMLLALVWTVDLHRNRMRLSPESDDLSGTETSLSPPV